MPFKKLDLQEAIRTVKSEVNLVDLVGKYVDLRKNGTDYAALCPFHNEKTPSFHVNAKDGVYHCFGCGAGGDAISFVQEIESLNFIDALRFLYKEYNLGDVDSLEDHSIKSDVIALNGEVASHYTDVLFSAAGKDVLAYLHEKRGLTDETIRKFRLGLALSKDKKLQSILGKYGEDAAETSALMNASHVPFFHDRITIPITDIFGNVIAFGGRALISGQNPKYLNSPESVCFHKKETLYQMSLARKEIVTRKEAILVEGYFDVIALHQAGFSNAVCSMGTSLTDDQAKLLKNASTVYICYDPDAAGIHGTDRGIVRLIRNNLAVKAVTLPQGKDPDEVVQEHGSGLFSKLIHASPQYDDYLYERLRFGANLSTPDSVKSWIMQVFDLLVAIPDSMFEEKVLGDVSTLLSLSKPALQMKLREYRQSKAYGLNRDVAVEEVPSTKDPSEPTQAELVKHLLFNISVDEILAHKDIFTIEKYRNLVHEVLQQRKTSPGAVELSLMTPEDRSLASSLMITGDRELSPAIAKQTLLRHDKRQKEHDFAKTQVDALKAYK